MVLLFRNWRFLFWDLEDLSKYREDYFLRFYWFPYSYYQIKTQYWVTPYYSKSSQTSCNEFRVVKALPNLSIPLSPILLNLKRSDLILYVKSNLFTIFKSFLGTSLKFVVLWIYSKPHEITSSGNFLKFTKRKIPLFQRFFLLFWQKRSSKLPSEW